MKHWILYNPQGEITRSGVCADADFELQSPGGVSLIEGKATGRTHYVLNGALTSYTPAQIVSKQALPQVPSLWSNESMSWVSGASLSESKVLAISKMRAARESLITGTFSWDGSTFDSDQVSQTRLMGLFVDSKEPSFLPTPWRLSNNSWRTLSAENAVEIWAALRGHIRGAFQTFAAKEASINSASSIEEVNAISW